jgi:hypothetical protein
MDIQIKIKILKYFVDELQKPFYKNKEERNSENEGRRPLSKPLDENLWMKTFG